MARTTVEYTVLLADLTGGLWCTVQVVKDAESAERLYASWEGVLLLYVPAPPNRQELARHLPQHLHLSDRLFWERFGIVRVLQEGLLLGRLYDFFSQAPLFFKAVEDALKAAGHLHYPLASHGSFDGVFDVPEIRAALARAIFSLSERDFNQVTKALRKWPGLK